MPFHRVLDLTTVLLVEVYRELGMKFDEVIKELDKQISDPAKPRRSQPPPEVENDASLAMLNSMIGQSSFRGPRG